MPCSRALPLLLILFALHTSTALRAQERPPRSPAPGDPRGPQRRPPAERYSIQQATSDRAQLHTIAFDGLAFLTGDFASDTFLPPGKVSDYFGFQYLRDTDVREGGHNTSFLTRIAFNVLWILNDAQRGQLADLAGRQRDGIRRYALMRYPLIAAFRRNLEGNAAPGNRGLDQSAVARHSAELYALDGKLAVERAQVMATILRSLSGDQKAAFGQLKFGDSATWPARPEPPGRRALTHDDDVAVMTYASEMFTWYAGSLEADTYFCPERHGMYLAALV